MVRAAKKKRNTDSSAFQESVDASAAHDDELAGTGVVIDDGGLVHLVKLTEEQHRKVGDELAATLLEIEQKKAEKKRVVKVFKDDVLLLEVRRDVLRDEWVSGQRKEDAQPPLPGMDS